MKNNTKNDKALSILMLLFSLSVFAGTPALDPNHTFTYQGQLMDGGSLANGSYDFTLQMHDVVIGNSPFGSASIHLAVVVSDGIFTLQQVDLGENTFDGVQSYLQVSVRPTAVGAYIDLSPRHLIQAVPMANNLTRKGATTGQVLEYNAFLGQWSPTDTFSGDYSDLSNKPFIPAGSPWIDAGSSIAYPDGSVTIGSSTLSGSALHVRSAGLAQVATANFFGGSSTMHNDYYEDNTLRGYIGSFFGAADDFNIGASTGHMQLTTTGQIRMDIDATGNTEFSGSVGIGRPASGTQALVLEDAGGGLMFMYGGNSPFIRLHENNLPRGDIGSALGNNEDFSIGTATGNTVGKMHLATQSTIGLTVDTDGDIGIGTQSPTNLLEVSAPLNKNPLSVKVNNFTALRAASNLGVSVGSSNLPPASGLYVRTEINSEVSGDADVKAHVYGKINGSGAGSIYIAGSSNGFSVVRTAVGVYRITLTTPASFFDYSVIVTVVDAATPQIATTSTSSSANSFDIHVWNIAGVHVDSNFDFVVFKK